MPLYIRADNSVIYQGLKDADTDVAINSGVTMTFTVFRLVARDGALSTTALTSSSASFAAGDVGKIVVVAGAGEDGSDLRTTIAAYVSATQVTLTDAASTTVTGADVYRSLSAAQGVSMDYVTGSDGDYVGVCDEGVPLRNGAYAVEVVTDAGSDRKDYRWLNVDAVKRGSE